MANMLCKSHLASGESYGQNTRITLDEQRKGSQVTFGASSTRLSGSGLALCVTTLEQDRAYWEVTDTTGAFWVGVAARNASVERVPARGTARPDQDRQQLWGLHSEDELLRQRREGAIIGVCYDQSLGPPTVDFFLDGRLLEAARISHIRGAVKPAMGVCNSEASCNFSHSFACPPPEQYRSDGVIAAFSMT